MTLDFLKRRDGRQARYRGVARRGEGRRVHRLGAGVRRRHDVLVKAQVRVAFISSGRAQPIPKALRRLLNADLPS